MVFFDWCPESDVLFQSVIWLLETLNKKLMRRINDYVFINICSQALNRMGWAWWVGCKGNKDVINLFNFHPRLYFLCLDFAEDIFLKKTTFGTVISNIITQMKSSCFLIFSLAIRGLAERERRRIIYICRNFGIASSCWNLGWAAQKFSENMEREGETSTKGVGWMYCMLDFDLINVRGLICTKIWRRK